MTALVSIDGISVAFDGVQALRDVSFDVPRGCLLAVIGPNGAGKSTLFNAISGIQRSDAGRLRFDGRDVTGWRGDRLMRAGLSRTFQLVRLAGALTVRDNVLLGLHGRGWSGRRAAYASAGRALELAGLPADDRRHPPALSYGERKRVELARAIVSDPRLLLLDEPFAGLSAEDTAGIVEVIGRMHERGTTIMLVEHDMPTVMSIAQRIVVLNFGQKLAEGPPAAIKSDQAVLDAYLGVDAREPLEGVS